MYKGKKRIISLIMTATLLTSTALTYPVCAAGGNNSGASLSKQQELALAKSTYLNSLASQKIAGKVNIQNDNKQPTETQKLNPEDNVRLIVQLDNKAVTDYMPGAQIAKTGFNKELETKVLDSQAVAKANVLKVSKDIKIRDSYYLLLDGFSVEAKAKDIAKIEKLPGVKHVTIAREFVPDMNYATNITNVQKVWNDPNSPYQGQGQVVAIIDTGIDMNHKDMKITDPSKEKLTPVAGFNDKVPYGHNFADGNDIVKAAPGTSEHGMHVAGIVAANGAEDQIATNEAIRGCAPEAQLLAMKVFSNNPAYTSAFSDDIIAAIEDSVAHNADVINMSLGSSAAFQDPQSAEQIAVTNANNAGTVCCISAGNSQYALAPYHFAGVNDDGVVGSPGIAKDSLCVASYENTNITSYGLDYTADGATESSPMLYTNCTVNPLDALTNAAGYSLVSCGIGQDSDFTGKDLTGKIALIQRGSIAFVDKQKNAQAHGAIGVIVYDNRAEALVSMASDPSVTIPAMFISQADGTKLQGLIASNLKVFIKGSVATVANPSSGDMSSFTSWGPTPDLEMKPEVAAPGGNIWSTVNDNRYESMSGTSMASPHTAGIMALISQHMNDFAKNNKITLNADAVKADLEKDLVINTAVPKLDPSTKSATYFSPRREGAGLVDAYAAVKDNVTITNDNGNALFALKEIDNNTDTFNVNLHNYGTTDITYTCKDLSGVMTENTPANGYTTTMSYDTPLTGAALSFDQPEITVPAGKDAVVKVTITLPAQATNNYVEGYLSFVDKAGTAPTIGTSYMGYYGKWEDMAIVDDPVWSDNTVLGYTTLDSVVGGKLVNLGLSADAQGNQYIDPSKIAFASSSTSELGALFTNVIPNVTLLRNSKSGSVQVLDSKGNVVRTITLTTDLRKNILADSPTTTDGSWAWDGLLYDKATGKMVPAPEGNYSIRLTNTIDFQGAQPQSLDMPVTVDNTAPELTNATTTNSGTVSFAASDNLSGFSGIVYIVDGQIANAKALNTYPDADGNKLNYDAKTGLYSFDINAGAGYHVVDIIGFDNAGNMTGIASAQQDTGFAVNFDSNSIKVGQIFNTLTPVIYGSVTSMPTELKVGGKDLLASSDYFDPSTLTFAVPLNLTEGLNKVSVEAKDQNGNEISYSLNVYADVSKPTVKVDNYSTIMKTTDEKYTLTGTVQDDLFGYTLYLDGQAISSINLEVPNEAATLQTFKTDLDLHYGTNTFTLTAVDLAGNVTDMPITIVRLADRLAGTTRIDTAIQVAQNGWQTSDYAVLVAANNYPDAIVATPLAKAYNAPILLTGAAGANGKLETSVVNELKALNVKHVLVVGGTGVVSSNVEATVKSATVDVTRIAGTDRYQTSVEVAKYLEKNNFANDKTVVVAAGNGFADAISISSYAAAKGYPILLVDNNKMPAAVASFITTNNIAKSYIIGGNGVVSTSVEKALPNPTRFGGATRYETNALVLTNLAKDMDFTNVYVASGQNFPDALAATALAAKNNAPIMLVAPTGAASCTKTVYTDNSGNIKNMFIVGGTGALPDSAFLSLVD